MYFPALLYTCILSMLFLIDGIPVRPDNFRSSVKMQADAIIYRITDYMDKKLNLSSKIIVDPELYTEVPADRPIQGLGSIVDTLSIFQKVLKTLPVGHASQLQTDVNTLLGNLKNRMTFMRCTPKEPANRMSLDNFLKENATNHVTVRYMTLDRLKQFVEKLRVNLDQLNSC